MNEIVVFDLDGTLLSNDSTKYWLSKQLKSNILRFISAIIILPVAIPLMKFKKSKSLGASLFLWIATYGLNRTQLEENLNHFAVNVKNNSISNLYWFKDGLAVLNNHLDEGRSIIIVTASPEPLAKALFKSMHLDVKVIGTPLKNIMGGWIGGVHCRHTEKLKRLKREGVNLYWYATYSDDVEEDYPILQGAKYAYLINGHYKNLLNKKLENICFLEWD